MELSVLAVTLALHGCVDDTPWRDYTIKVREGRHWYKITTRGQHRARWYLDGELRVLWKGSRVLWVPRPTEDARATVKARIKGPCGPVITSRRLRLRSRYMP